MQVSAIRMGTPIARVRSVHIGQPIAPHDLWQAWPSATPDTLALLGGTLIGSAAYARGIAALWRRAGVARGIPRWRVGAFAAAVLALLIADASPLDALAGELFAAHMVQHLLIISVVAPLLLLGEPGVVLLWALPMHWRRGIGLWWRRARLRRIAGALMHPRVAVPLHLLAVACWHVPTLYDSAERSGALHVVEHALFLSTALLFWYPVIDRHTRRHFGAPVVILSLFVVALGCVVLGALLAMAPRPWYDAHLASSARWGLLPLADQQLAGVIMWVPAGLVYLAAMAAIALPALAARSSGGRKSPGLTGVHGLP